MASQTPLLFRIEKILRDLGFQSPLKDRIVGELFEELHNRQIDDATLYQGIQDYVAPLRQPQPNPLPSPRRIVNMPPATANWVPYPNSSSPYAAQSNWNNAEKGGR